MANFQLSPEAVMTTSTYVPHRRNRLSLILCVAGLLGFSSTIATAAPEDDVRLVFDQFIAAQNAHDPAAVRDLLLDSPNFLWVTRGAPIWGRDAAMKRFEALYQGTWKLSPDLASLKTVLVNDGMAQLYVPITFNIGASGQSAPDTPFLMNQTLVKTAAGWRIANILPIHCPRQQQRSRNDGWLRKKPPISVGWIDVHALAASPEREQAVDPRSHGEAVRADPPSCEIGGEELQFAPKLPLVGDG